MTKRVLYPTLTKPILVKGVPRDWAFLTGFTAPFLYFFVGMFSNGVVGIGAGLVYAAVMWVIGYFLAKYWDPEFLTIILKKRVVFQRTQGPGKYTGNRYWG